MSIESGSAGLGGFKSFMVLGRGMLVFLRWHPLDSGGVDARRVVQ